MEVINTTEKLKEKLALIAQDNFVTVDTEFHRQSTYYPKLCLIQLASPHGEILIDPLSSKLDLAPFFELMQRQDIVKVFHAARQDIEIIYLLSGEIPTPLFDTQVAAMACGYGESVSYDTLVHKIKKIRLDKSSRFTDWTLRPLTSKQLKYAIADVTHLRDVYLALKKKLAANHRLDWLTEEMSVLESPNTYKNPPELAWKRVKGIKSKIRKAPQFAVLQNLAAWREKSAQHENVPRSYILTDESLVEIAIQLPQDRKALLAMRALKKPPRHKLDTDSVLKAIKEGQQSALNEPPQFAAWSSQKDHNKSEAEVLKLLLKIISEKQNVAQKMIATSDDINELVSEKDKADIALMRGWRYDLFGKQALAMLNGKLAVKFENGKLRIFEIE